MAVVSATEREAGNYDAIDRAKLPVYDSGNESGNRILNMDHPMRELYVANDSDGSDLVIQITGESGLDISFTLKPGDTIDERLPEFLTVTVTATDSWRWYVRSARTA